MDLVPYGANVAHATGVLALSSQQTLKPRARVCIWKFMAPFTPEVTLFKDSKRV
ncbi:hypothetical protein DPMN_042686 [Dreissena polymorpha]|uniref:Uncharacterized protein n=1 Tax=Dreissena polymorpha TaxID=45954 RepID=A0A9D4D0U2_DREPO|nr:hypothetical protein DPMN_042686 [Dreissena polymorpha]